MDDWKTTRTNSCPRHHLCETTFKTFTSTISNPPGWRSLKQWSSSKGFYLYHSSPFHNQTCSIAHVHSQFTNLLCNQSMINTESLLESTSISRTHRMAGDTTHHSNSTCLAIHQVTMTSPFLCPNSMPTFQTSLAPQQAGDCHHFLWRKPISGYRNNKICLIDRRTLQIIFSL